jgi:hypothetical protein
MRKTSERRTQSKQGSAVATHPDRKDRPADEVFDIVEKVEAPDDERMIPEKIAQRKGYITLQQLARVMDLRVQTLYAVVHTGSYKERWVPRRPEAVGRLQRDCRTAAKGTSSPFLFRREELLDWVRSNDDLRAQLPPELQ